jgi:hypothetical protein
MKILFGGGGENQYEQKQKKHRFKVVLDVAYAPSDRREDFFE